VRVAVGKGSAYDLYLTRTIKQAEIVRAPTGNEAIAMFERDKLEVAGGVEVARCCVTRSRAPGLAVMDGPLHGESRQAMGRAEGARSSRGAVLRNVIRGAQGRRGFVADAAGAEAVSTTQLVGAGGLGLATVLFRRRRR
jgi:polar amino acid transport system substrate-binding protein